MKIFKGILVLGLIAFSACKEEEKSLAVSWVSSTENSVWTEKKYELIENKEIADILISIDTNKQEQEITGFGGCFNELGWDALGMVTPEEKQQILND